MVSSARIADRTASQSVTSVASRPSHSGTRHRSGHRPGRSHHGGSIPTSSNDFPIFTYTGDTEIAIRAGSQEKRFLLHRLILTQCSGFFEASTSEGWSRNQTTGLSKPDGTISRISEDDDSSTGSTLVQSDHGGSRSNEKRRWRFELDWANRGEEEEPILVQTQPTYAPMFNDQPTHTPTMAKPSNAQAGFFRSMANLAGMQSVAHLPQSEGGKNTDVDPLIRDYDNLFRIFYNFPPRTQQRPRIDHHLLGFGSRLFKQISKYPPSYLKLGYLARSRVIFTEALIHVVGQWPAALPNLRNGSYAPLPDAVLDLIEDKYEDLEDLKARVESKLFRLSLTTSRGERVGPHNAYLDWLAVSLFRQWLIENMTPPPAPILKNTPNAQSTVQANGVASQSGSSRPTPTPDPAARVYRLIGSSSSQAYLTHEELKRFLKIHPIQSADSLYTRETMKRFERKMDEIKRLAREIVKPLMRNFLELEVKASPGQAGPATVGSRENTTTTGLPYLTCTRVEEADLPWN
ncbi:hypothetical protein N7470_002054 [Penicillium chermesinum]|nr:hypothetical protein N7470_002054 [Penicillium chermesinum]